MQEFDYAYLRGFIKEHFGTNQKFAQFIGVGAGTLYERLANKTSFSQSEIDKVGHEAIGRKLSPDELNRLFFTHKIRKTV